MTLFPKLLGMYRSSTQHAKTPTEDFTTELWAEVLRLYPDLCRQYIHCILGITESIPESERVQVDTQKPCRRSDDRNCRIDLVLTWTGHVCFIENKVEAADGFDQLREYRKVLDNIEGCTHLVYCTKYYVGESNRHHADVYHRWCNVDNLVQKYIGKHNLRDDTVAYQFHEYLKSKNMGEQKPLDLDDIEILSKLRNTLSKLDELMEKIKEKYASIFGNQNLTNHGIDQLSSRHARYTMKANGVFGQGTSQIGFGFSVGEDPSLFVFIYYVIDENGDCKLFDKHFSTWEEYHVMNTTPRREIWISIKSEISEYIAGGATIVNENKLLEWYNSQFVKINDVIISVTNEKNQIGEYEL